MRTTALQVVGNAPERKETVYIALLDSGLRGSDYYETEARFGVEHRTRDVATFGLRPPALTKCHCVVLIYVQDGLDVGVAGSKFIGKPVLSL